VNTNKKIQKSTGYFIFLLKMPRLTEIQSAQIVVLLEAGLSHSGIEQEFERALHEIWHEIPHDSIRICINIARMFRRGYPTPKWQYTVLNASNTCPLWH